MPKVACAHICDYATPGYSSKTRGTQPLSDLQISTDSDGGVSVPTRSLSHNTTAVLKLVEQSERPVAVTKHNRVVAALIPMSAKDLVLRWISSRPDIADYLRSTSQAPQFDPDVRGFFDAMPPNPVPDSAGGYAPVNEVGVRDFSKRTSTLLSAGEAGQTVLIRRYDKIAMILVPCTRTEFVRLLVSRSSAFAKELQDLGAKSEDPNMQLSRSDVFEFDQLKFEN